MKNMNIVLQSKEIQRDIRWALLYFFGSFGLFWLLALLYRFFLPYISIPFIPAETGEVLLFEMPLAEVLDIAFLGFLFSMNVYKAQLRIQKSNEHDESERKHYFFITGLIVYNYGFIVHLVANQIDHFLGDVVAAGTELTSVPGLERLYYAIYFWDEIVSHIFIGVGFVLLVLCLLYHEGINKKFRQTKIKPAMKLLGLLVGLGFGYAMVQGQSALVVAPLFVPILLVCLFRGRDKPMHKVMVLFCIGFFLFLVLYGGIVGLKDHYPYFYQATEVGLFPDV